VLFDYLTGKNEIINFNVQNSSFLRLPMDK